MPKEKDQGPRVAVGAFIFDARGELLLMRSPNWNGKWIVPGGGVETGESLEAAMRREIMEEVGLEITGIEYLGFSEALDLEGQYQGKVKHHVFFDYRCLAADKDAARLGDEATEYAWRRPEEWLAEDLCLYTKKRLTDILKDKDDYEYKYKLALADYQNLLRRTAREKEDFARYAHEDLVRTLLPAYENLLLSLDHAGEGGDGGFIEGIRHVAGQFEAALRGSGVVEIEASGRQFDPAVMEALEELEPERPEDRGKVARVIRRGFSLRGRVIQAARVAVYKQ